MKLRVIKLRVETSQEEKENGRSDLEKGKKQEIVFFFFYFLTRGKKLIGKYTMEWREIRKMRVETSQEEKGSGDGETRNLVIIS